MTRFDLNMLVVIESIMLERNVTRAAENLAMSQPAASNALRRARQLTKDELFVKTARGVRPTSRMQAMWPELRQSLQSLRATFAPQDFDPRTDASAFRVAITDSIAQEVVPIYALRLHTEAPYARVTFVAHTNTSSIEGLESGVLDCAVGMFPAVPAGVHVRGLRTDNYVCVMRKGHPLARHMNINQFVAQPQVLVKPSGQDLGVVDGWLSLKERSRNITIVVNHFADALKIVSQSDLLTCMPKGYLSRVGRTVVDLDSIEHRELPFETQHLLYKMLWHERLKNHPAHQWFRTRLAEICEELENEASPTPAARP